MENSNIAHINIPSLDINTTSLADILKEFHEDVDRLHKLIDKLEEKYGKD